MNRENARYMWEEGPEARGRVSKYQEEEKGKEGRIYAEQLGVTALWSYREDSS